MKTLNAAEFLVPVGNEFIVPSSTEAFLVFRDMELSGDIRFGIAHTNEGDSLCWLLTPKKGPNIPLKAIDDNINTPVTSFSQINVGSYFYWKQHYYQLTLDDCLGLLVKELTVFSTEADVYGYAQACGYGDVNIHAVKVYEIGAKKKFLFSSWYLEMPDFSPHPDTFVHMFFSDRIPPHLSTNSLNWEFMEVGDIFIKDNELWKLHENNKEGLFINKAQTKMKIIKREA